MVTSSILLNGSVTRWATFGVGLHPVQGLAVIATLLQPSLQHVTLDWLVPGLCTRETKHVSTVTRDRKGTHKLHLNSSVTSWTWTPLEYFVTFYKTVGDKNLILYFDSRMGDQVEGLLILQDCVTITRTVEGADSIIRDLGGDVLSPAAVAVHVSFAL